MRVNAEMVLGAPINDDEMVELTNTFEADTVEEMVELLGEKVRSANYLFFKVISLEVHTTYPER